MNTHNAYSRNGGTAAVRIGGGGEVAYTMLIAEDECKTHARTFRRIKRRVKYGTADGRTRLQRLTPPAPDRHAGTDHQSHRPTGHRQHSSPMPSSTRRERNPEGEIPSPHLHQFVSLLSVLHQRRRYHIPLDN